MTGQVETPPDLAGAAFENEIRSKAAELKRELIRQTLEDQASWAKAVRIEWEQAHPGLSVESTSVLPSLAEFESYRDTVRNEYYEWVEPAFERYLAPDPDATNPMIEALRTIESMFEGSQDNAGNFAPASAALVRINDVRTDMSQWQGDLQVNFIDNFLTPLQSVSVNQAAVAKYAREQLECNKILYIRYRKGILDLVRQSIEAVRTLKHGKDPETYMWGTLIAVAVGTIVAAVPVGIAVAGIVLNVGGTLAQGLTPDPPKTTELSAPTGQEVANRIVDAMNKMDRDISEQERNVETAITNLYNAIAVSRSQSISSNASGPLAVARPSITSARFTDIVDGSLRPRD